MKKTILLIAPHEDDELNLIGSVADQLRRNHVKVSIMFVTNGDYVPEAASRRHAETKTVAKAMGIERLYFLGYSDSPAFDGKHIFHTQGGEEYVSSAGHSHTYGVDGQNEYSFIKHSIHRAFTRENVRTDMKECILDVRADMIICVDFDEHADHRMTSILFDEIMAELIRETNYRPVVLKKFAYAGVWFGEDDYYSSPMRETILKPEEYFPYSPGQEIRTKVHRRNFPARYENSAIFKLYDTYKSQFVKEHFRKMVNADSMYFYRDTNNLALSADIEVSSGEKKYLNDFKLADTNHVDCNIEEIRNDPSGYAWFPTTADRKKTITFRFEAPVSVKQINFCMPFNNKDHPDKVGISINGTRITEKVFGKSTFEKIVFYNAYNDVSELTVQILADSGGFCEIEIFDHESIFDWEEAPFRQYSPKSLSLYRPVGKHLPETRKKLHILSEFRKELRSNGIPFYIKKVINKIKRLILRK